MNLWCGHNLQLTWQETYESQSHVWTDALLLLPPESVGVNTEPHSSAKVKPITPTAAAFCCRKVLTKYVLSEGEETKETYIYMYTSVTLQ